jgi:HD-GYP domain-containing protein (c-di-GMP phosphodiesterase class II)
MVYSVEEAKLSTKSDKHVQKDDKAALGLLLQVSKTVGSVSRMTEMLEQTIKMTQQTLAASAASVLLFHDNEQELCFEVASGPVGKVLKQVRVGIDSGIAGWVARTGKPLIVNDVGRSRNFHGDIDKITGFVTKSLVCVPLVVHRKILGVIEVLNKLDESEFNEHDLETVVSVAAVAAMAIENTRLHQTVLDAYKGTITALAAAIDAKDPYTRGHSQRVMKYSLLGSKALSLSPEEVETLEYASILHDIGKISVDAQILNKPDDLTQSEWNIIREHPALGANMLKGIPFLERTSELVLHHHERYDGKGYPDGLEGEDIPIGARIIAVADAFDTMTTDRSYRSALNVEDSISELRNCSGTQFCPVAVEAFVTGFHSHAMKHSSGLAVQSGKTAN